MQREGGPHRQLLSVSSLQFTSECTSRIDYQFSKTFGADAIPAERDSRLLLEKIGSGNRDRIKRSVLRDEPFDNIIRGMARIRIEHLNSSRFGLFRDHGPSTVEHKDNVRSGQILKFGQYPR